jgi:hypothetical protein
MLALRLIYHAMKAYVGVEVPIARFLTLALHWESGLHHAAAALVLMKGPRCPRMVACPCPESNHDSSVVQPLLWEQNIYLVRPVFTVIEMQLSVLMLPRRVEPKMVKTLTSRDRFGRHMEVMGKYGATVG